MVRLLHSPPTPEVLASMLSTLARKHNVPGAQLAVHHGGETTTAEYGEREHGKGGAVTRDTAFPVGSISKCFTATVAMALAADGDLYLDDPIEEYLPELGELGEEVTLRHLLSHTGGWASGPDSADVAGASPRRYVMDQCRQGNVVVPPGTAFSYSNLGYVLVGLLIETVTGMTWREATESVVLRPLGIEPGFLATTGGLPRSPREMAAGHSVNRSVGRIRPVPQSLAPAEAPTGGLALSAADLTALALLHVGEGRSDLLPEAFAELMRKPVYGAVPFGLADGWGLGLALFQSGATTWAGHDGNAHGTSCYLRFDPAGGTVIALTSNANTGSELWSALLDELADLGVPVPRSQAGAPVTGTAPPPLDAAGTYRNGEMDYQVTVSDGELHLSVDGDDPTPLSCAPDLAFSLRDPATGRLVLGGRFVRDRLTQEIAAIQLGGRLARRQSRQQRVAGSRRIA